MRPGRFKPKSRQKIESPLNDDEFKIKSRELLDQIYNGLIDIVSNDPENCSIEYYRQNNSNLTDDKMLHFTIEKCGTYQLIINEKQKQIHLFSPISFTFFYIYDINNDRWICTMDSHNIIELLSREINDNTYGYPKF